MKRNLSVALLAAVAGGSAVALAGGMTQVIPPAYENTPGTGVFIGPHTGGQRTYQMLIHESLLTDYVGLELSGFSWRLPQAATSNWPPASDATYANYDVYLSNSVAPADRSLTFAENIVGVQTQVRSGPWVVEQNSYTFGNTPNELGPELKFDSNWSYAGGHLLIEIRHTGNDVGTRNVDALITSTPGYGTEFSAAWQSSYTATSGAQGNFTIIGLTAVPEPASVLLLALAALGLRRR